MTRVNRSNPIYLLDSSDGLPSNQVHRIARDSWGRLWLATPAGAGRYDGARVTLRDRQHGLQCNGLRCIAVDRRGWTWIGTDLGIEVLDADGQPRECIDAADWRFGLCEDILLEDDAVWLGTAHGLVKLAFDGSRDRCRVAFTADTGFVNDLLRFAPGRLLATSSVAGLIETDEIQAWDYRCPDLLNVRVSRLARGGEGRILAGTTGGLLIIDDALRRVQTRLFLPDVDPQVTALSVASERIWVAFGRTLVQYREADGTFCVAERFAFESVVNDILVDDLDNVFVATNNSGLALVSCLRAHIERLELPTRGGVFVIKPDGAGGHWVGGDRVFARIDAASRPVLGAAEVPAGLPETIVWDIHSGCGGTWAATQRGLYFAPPGQRFERKYRDDPVLSVPNRVLLQVADELWVGTLKGLARIGAGRCEAVEAGGTPLGYVYALCPDPKQGFWVCTLGRGLWRYRGRLEPCVAPALAPRGNTYAVAFSAAGRMAVLQDERVVVIEADGQSRVAAELGPVSGWSAAWIDERTLAIGASDGLRVLDVARGALACRVQTLFASRDWEFTNNRTLLPAPGNRFLCGVNGGLFGVELDALRKFSPPVCRLDTVEWQGVEPRGTSDSFELPTGNWSLRVRVFAAWLIDTRQVRYEFQLEGFSDTWSEPRAEPEISFNSLPPGHYWLKCRASTPLTGYGPETPLVTLHVVRPLWALGWSDALAAVALGFDRLVRKRVENRKLLDRKRALEAAVAERTQSLLAANEELAAVRDAYIKLAEVDALTQIGNRRYFEKELNRAMALTSRLAMPLCLMIADIDYFKAVNDRLGHPVGDEYLRKIGRVLADTARLGEDIVARLGGEEFAILLINTRQEGGQVFAERVRGAVAALELANSGGVNGRVSLSIGVTVRDPSEQIDAAQLIERADIALYQAKREGRDRIVVL